MLRVGAEEGVEGWRVEDEVGFDEEGVELEGKGEGGCFEEGRE